GEEGLGERVVPALTGAPDRQRDIAILGKGRVLTAGVLGEFNWPSQHPDSEGLRWVLVRGSGRFAGTGGRCPRRGDRVWPGVRIVSGSGPGSLEVCGRTMRPPRSACPRPSACDGFATLAA